MRTRCLEICIAYEPTNQATNQATNQPTFGSRRVADDACANFHPFPAARSSPRCALRAATLRLSLPNLFRLRIPSDLFSRVTPGLSFTFHRRRRRRRRRRRLRVSSPISLERAFFAILFAPSLSHPETSWDGGGVQRVQPSVSGLCLVSLVTAPHKGIAL